MTDLTIETAIALGVAVLAVLAFLVERFYFDAAMGERIKGLETQMREVRSCMNDLKMTKEEVGVIRTKVDLFWGALEAQLPGMLLKGNPLAPTSRVAILLSKFKDNNITNQELIELTHLLDEEIRNPAHTPGEILAMVLMNATLRSKVEITNGATSYHL